MSLVWWYLWGVSRISRVVLGVTVALSVVACVFIVTVTVGQGVEQASLWAGVVAALAGVIAAVAAIWPLVARQSSGLVPPDLELPAWVVDRPVEAGQAVAALMRGGGGLVGLTTGLYGAGGFGKTTLARVVCADARVRRFFRGGVFLVTVGRDVRGSAAVAAKVNDVIKLVAGEDATFTDPELAGRRLGALLDVGPRRLLVLDDVWEAGQLAPFAVAGSRCARLLTTRVPGLLGGRDVAVRVDQMSGVQARLVLTAQLPPLGTGVADGLLAVTGRWPLLLRLVNKILANAVTSGAELEATAAQLLERLRAEGPAAADTVLGNGTRGLDVGKPDERSLAVRATIEASTSLLRPPDRQRFAELAVFAEDEIVPFELVSLLWRRTAALDGLQSSQLCARLAQLALIDVSPEDGGAGGVTLHDVLRDYLRGELGAQRMAELNELLLRIVAEDRPEGSEIGDAAAVPVPWWELRPGGRYLQYHLIRHLLDAGRRSEAIEVACDLRWAELRVQQSGPAAASADLALADTAKAARMRAALARAAHLLGPTDPADAVIAILHSRLADDPDWGPQIAAAEERGQRPGLRIRWPLPDLPDPALRRVISGHGGQVNGAAVAPDGSWLATGSSDGTVRIWEPVTGQQQAVFSGHRGRVYAVAAAPDGSWLAAGGGGRGSRVLIWDVATSTVRAVLASREVNVMAVAPDGSWLAAGDLSHRVRIYDIATGKQRAKLTGGSGWTTAVVIAPDGSWLAMAGYERAVRIWDMAASRLRTMFTTGAGWVTVMARAPDGSWLAGGCSDRTIRIWDLPSGNQRMVLEHPTGLVTALAVAPDGSWVVGGASDGALRIWDTASWAQLAVLNSLAGQVAAVVVAPDGTWVAAGYNDGTARIWDMTAARPGRTRAGYGRWVDTVAALPDGSELVTGGPDPRVRIWDAATGIERARLTGHSAAVTGAAVAQDGTWIATAGGDPDVRVWDTAAASERATLPGHGTWTAALAAAPDGTWLATSGFDGVVSVRDTATGKHRAVLAVRRTGKGEIEKSAAERWAALHANGRLGDFRIRDVITGKRRPILIPRQSPVYAVAVAPDKTWLAAVGIAPVVRVWDLAAKTLRFVLSGHQGAVYAAAASPDSSWLATAGADGTVRIWDMTTGKQQAILSGHHGAVYSVATTPDNPWLATGGADRTLRIWETVGWQAQALMRVEDAIQTCAWLRDGALACGGPAGLYMFDFQSRSAASAMRTPSRRTIPDPDPPPL